MLRFLGQVRVHIFLYLVDNNTYGDSEISVASSSEVSPQAMNFFWRLVEAQDFSADLHNVLLASRQSVVPPNIFLSSVQHFFLSAAGRTEFSGTLKH